MSSKEEIRAAVAKKFKTKDVDLGGGVKVTIRELSRSEHNALNRRLYECDAAGVPVDETGGGFLVHDPSGNAVLLATVSQPAGALTGPGPLRDANRAAGGDAALQPVYAEGGKG